jgi:hypothetical protein
MALEQLQADKRLVVFERLTQGIVWLRWIEYMPIRLVNTLDIADQAQDNKLMHTKRGRHRR